MELASDEEDRVAILAALGDAVMKWSMIESECAIILDFVLFGCKGDRLGQNIFYSVQNTKPRLLVVDSALFNEYGPDHENFKQWAKIFDCIERESSERNQIVHGNLIAGFLDFDRSLYSIAPKHFSSRERKHPPDGVKKHGFDVHDIGRHSDRVNLLRTALWAFRAKIGVNDTKPPESVEQCLSAWEVARGQREWPSIKL